MRIPLATYRLQLNRGFTFDQAAEIVDYLNALGVSDAYASRVQMARAGSPHGYDVVEHAVLNPELGGDEGSSRFAAELRRREMGLLLDVVPNHMCIGSDANWRWRDV